MGVLNKWKRHICAGLSFVLILASAINMTACSVSLSQVKARDLMDGVSSKTMKGKETDDRFIDNMARFSLELFKKTTDEKDNALISPLSVMLALAMTANGADKETLSQMEKVLGNDISIEELNGYLYSYVNSLPSQKKSKLNIANSIWFRDNGNRLTVEQEFLQKNADYYHASAYKSAFDSQTLQDINSWVKQHTDGLIDKIVDQIDAETVMYLINAMVFDGEWENVYTKNDLYQGEFFTVDGTKQPADFMRSDESIYLDDGKATGFIKPYAGGHYSFAALVPNEGISIGDYIQSLTGKGFLNTIRNAENTAVNSAMPKFSYDYTIPMNDALKELGMPEAFLSDKADFTRLGKSPDGNIYIGEVLHKTFISVDERGTKAGAVTKVEMKTEGAMETKYVKLDKPFVYAIIDNSTNLPVFIGTVMSMEK